MKLELKHISPYLPYGLKCQTFWINEDNSIEEEGISEIVGIKIDCDNSTENPIKVVRKTRPNSKYLTYYAYNYNECKPILRPLSDLTKEITVNWERFVPIVELAKIADNYPKWNKNDIVTYYNEYSGGSYFGIKGISESSNLGDLVYEFHYDTGWLRFALRDNTRERPVSFINQLQLFEKLFEWHFNVFNLPENLFVDINTLTK